MGIFMKFIYIFFSLLFFFETVFADSQSFRSVDFINTIKKNRTPIHDFVYSDYKVNGVSYQARYLKSNGPGYYALINERNREENPLAITDQWGPYLTREEAEAQFEKYKNPTTQALVDITYLKGSYSSFPYKLESTLFSEKDKTLNNCYEEQVKEFEKATNDEQLSTFLSKYIGYKKIKIQLLDLRTGIPEEKPKKEFMNLDFTMTAVLDTAGQCKITTVKNLKELLNTHIEEHQVYLRDKAKDLDKKKLNTRLQVVKDFQADLEKTVDSFRSSTKVDAPIKSSQKSPVGR